MKLTLWKYDGNPLQINKENSISTITKVTDIQGHFKDNTSLKSPTFIIRKRNTVAYNYVSIEYDNYTYYYQIDDIVMVEDTQELHCTIDVLYTFRDYILTLSGTVERASRVKNNSTLNGNMVISKSDSRKLFDVSIEDSEMLTTSYQENKLCLPKNNKPLFDKTKMYYYITTTN